MEKVVAMGNGIGRFGTDCNDMIFDGREFANELSEELKIKISNFKKPPLLMTIYNEKDRASKAYTEIKAKKALELGVYFEAMELGSKSKSDVIEFIKCQNMYKRVDGLMIQTPLIDRETDMELCKLIDPKKDVDGLNPNSGVAPATVKAVLKILKLSGVMGKVVVVGQRGLVGSGLLKRINGAVGMSANELNTAGLREADVVISATGKAGLIKPEMLKRGVVCIDVGYPNPDFERSCMLVSSFFTPVPGGVGPVTVLCLFENLVETIDKSI